MLQNGEGGIVKGKGGKHMRLQKYLSNYVIMTSVAREMTYWQILMLGQRVMKN